LRLVCQQGKGNPYGRNSSISEATALSFESEWEESWTRWLHPSSRY